MFPCTSNHRKVFQYLLQQSHIFTRFSFVKGLLLVLVFVIKTPLSVTNFNKGLTNSATSSGRRNRPYL